VCKQLINACRFKGSTLEVMGIDDEADWAIVGGTGQFAMATGVIRKNWHLREHGPYIVEIAIEAFCPKIVKASWGVRLVTFGYAWFNNACAQYSVSVHNKLINWIIILQIQLPTKIGTWGGG
jgi:hypothetical protein